MKWVFGLLVLFNAGLFLWATGHTPKTTDFIRPPVNGETMMLLSEMTPVKVTGVTVQPEAKQPEPDTQSTDAEESDPVAKTPQQNTEENLDEEPAVTVIEETKQEPPLCLRVGPFFDEKLAGETAGRLKTLSLVVDIRKVKAREIRAYRVYLGPFDNKTQITAQRKLLTGSGVKDFYVKKEQGKKDIISLGLFTQSTGADSLTKQLKGKGITVQVRTEDRLLDPTFWLELTDSEANRTNKAELVAAKNWGDKRTTLSEFPCS